MNLIDKITAKQLRTDLPEFRVGDTISVGVKIKEKASSGKEKAGNTKERERVQLFEGLVMSIQGGGISRNFVVRKVSGSIGVEKIFPYNSPVIDSITVVRKGKVRQAKLGYIRKMIKEPRIKERRDKPKKAV